MSRRLRPNTNRSLQVEIWVGCTDKILISDAYLDSVLSPTERARAGRFAFDSLRHRYRVGRVALRKVLSEILGQPPTRLDFSVGVGGKPFISDGPFFNMSMSGSMLLVGVTTGAEIGVDIELVKRFDEMDRLTGSVLSPSEQLGIANLADSERLRGFYRAWTRKEAVTKALGVGLNCDLQSFSVPLSMEYGNHPVEVSPSFPSDKPWFVHPLQVDPATEAAIACSRPIEISRYNRFGDGLEW
jgi:4'-phosphopantetheinyl transferase